MLIILGIVVSLSVVLIYVDSYTIKADSVSVNLDDYALIIISNMIDYE